MIIPPNVVIIPCLKVTLPKIILFENYVNDCIFPHTNCDNLKIRTNLIHPDALVAWRGLNSHKCFIQCIRLNQAKIVQERDKQADFVKIEYHCRIF